MKTKTIIKAIIVIAGITLGALTGRAQNAGTTIDHVVLMGHYFAKDFAFTAGGKFGLIGAGSNVGSYVGYSNTGMLRSNQINGGRDELSINSITAGVLMNDNNVGIYYFMGIGIAAMDVEVQAMPRAKIVQSNFACWEVGILGQISNVFGMGFQLSNSGVTAIQIMAFVNL